MKRPSAIWVSAVTLLVPGLALPVSRIPAACCDGPVLEDAITDLIVRRSAQVRHATVALVSPTDRCSGVVVSPDLVLTTAHGIRGRSADSAEADMHVFLWDGTNVSGHVEFLDEAADVGVIRLSAPLGRDPAITPLAPVDAYAEDDVVLAAGCPGRCELRAEAVVRIGRIAVAGRQTIRATSPLTVGDSGGPLVDLQGRLVGLHQQIGVGSENSLHQSWRFLRTALPPGLVAEIAVADTPSVSVDADLHCPPEVRRRLQELTVRVLQKPSGSDAAAPFPHLINGTRLSADWIATKLSELGGESEFLIRLHDGSEHAVTRRHVVRENDLALLEFAAGTASGSQSTPPGPVTIDAESAIEGLPVFAGDGTRMGIVGRIHWTEPDSPVYAGVAVVRNEADQLVVNRVDATSPASEAGLQIADVICAVDGWTPDDLPSLADRLLRYQPGDVVSIVARSSDAPVEHRLRFAFPPAGQLQRTEFLDGLSGPLSRRRTGFEDVLQIDVVLTPAACGGPVLDRQGRLIGVCIARRGREATLVIPIEDVRKSARLALRDLQ